MAVAYVSDTDQSPATGSSFTYTSFAVSGTNPVVLVVVGMDISGGAATVSSVACSAGLSGTGALVKAQSKIDSRVEIWAIPAPSGTGTITVTLSASRPYQSNAILLSGADQSTPCPTGDATATDGDGTTNPLSATPSNLSANDAAVGAGANAVSGDGPTINQSQTFNNNSTSVNMAAGYHLGTGAMTCTWSTPTNDSTLVAVRVAAAASLTFSVVGRTTLDYSAD